MKETLLLLLIGFCLWPFLFTIGYYANGGDEKDLQKRIHLLRNSDPIISRVYGFVSWIFFDKQNRWLISFLSLTLLVVLKIGDAL